MNDYESQVESLAPHITNLVEHKQNPGKTLEKDNRAEYQNLRKKAKAVVEANPEQAAVQLEFLFQNRRTDVLAHREAVDLLYHLGGIHGYQARAVKLLAIAWDSPNAEVSEAADKAIEGVRRRRPRA